MCEHLASGAAGDKHEASCCGNSCCVLGDLENEEFSLFSKEMALHTIINNSQDMLLD
jgi:hypothetical protein